MPYKLMSPWNLVVLPIIITFQLQKYILAVKFKLLFVDGPKEASKDFVVAFSFV